jgi:peptide/nickel transport system substrate-binding protein
MITIRARASFCVIAGITAVSAACSGEARRAEPPAEPITLKIGMFSTRPDAPVGLAGLFTSEPLVAAAWDGRPVYKLAASVTESADQRTLTVTLRSDVRFHTGELITAPVVRDLLSKKLELIPQIAAISAIDDRSLLISMRKPSSVKAVDLSTLIVDSGAEGSEALRTGPFKLKALDPGVLEPFDEYYQGKPELGRIEIRRYATHRAAWTGMMRDEVNVLHEVSREAIGFVEAGGDIRAYPLLRPYYTALVFNARHGVLQRREVRVAINEAIDRDELVENAMRGYGRVAEGPYWPYHWAYPHGRFPTSFNPEAARLRLDGVGLKVGVRSVEQMPSRFAFSCLVLAGDDRFERIALLVQRQLYAVGIDMKIVAVPQKELVPRIASGDFDAFIMEAVSGRILSFAYQFWHSPVPGATVRFRTGYVAADAALDSLLVADTDDQIREAVADVMQVMRNDPPAAFLVWPREARAADIAFEIPYEVDRDIFGTIWQLKRAGPPRAARR